MSIKICRCACIKRFVSPGISSCITILFLVIYLIIYLYSFLIFNIDAARLDEPRLPGVRVCAVLFIEHIKQAKLLTVKLFIKYIK